jgi:hypothetical protein
MTRREPEPVPEVIIRRMNGIALNEVSAQCLDRIQAAEDLTATEAVRKALQLYDQLRLLRQDGTLAWIDPETNQLSEVEWV